MGRIAFIALLALSLLVVSMGSSPAHLIASSELSFLPTVFLQRARGLSSSRTTRAPLLLVRASSKGGGGKKNTRGIPKAATKKKESPWNDAIAQPKTTHSIKSSSKGRPSSSKSSKAQPKPPPSPKARSHDDSRILVSDAMPVEIEKVLQTEEPSTIPVWQTFVSSLCGVWRGVGAAFSPATAEMEAIALGSQDEFLYDCRILSTAKEMQVRSGIQRNTFWAVGNPLGEQGKGRLHVQENFTLPYDVIDDVDGKIPIMEGLDMEIAEDSVVEEVNIAAQSQNSSNTSFTADLENPALTYDTLMEEDELELEPGLVFFEDGSYSRGPLSLLTGDSEDLTPRTYKIEQCLVRGGHSRLRIVHTISVEEGGESVQLLRVAVYNEEWMGPSNMKSISDSGGRHLQLFSQQSRLKPQDLIGTWKVFELNAIAVLQDDMEAKKSSERPPYVYMTMETQKRRLLPEVPVHFADEDIMDIQDVTIMWLPGGISAYVDVKDEGILTIGVGWFDDGINLVMERDYNTDGKLCEVHSKSEVKGGWVGGRM